jgi:hypothetical protein
LFWCSHILEKIKVEVNLEPPSYCDMWPESHNLCICWAELRGARSHGNLKYTVTLGFDGAVGDICMVTTFETDCYHRYDKRNSSRRWFLSHPPSWNKRRAVEKP